MKKLISTLVIAGAMFGLVSASFAQAAGPKGGAPGQQKGQGGGRMRMGKMQEEILAKLNLTPAQQEKVKAHNKKMAEKMKTLFEGMQKNPGADRSAMRPKFEALREEGNKGLKAILTADQFKKFETLRKEARAKRASEGRGGAGGPGGAGVAGAGRGTKKGGGG